MGNALTPKRGKLDRPAICKPSPPTPIPPFLPAAYFAASVASPTEGHCSTFLIWSQAWTLLQAADHRVHVDHLPIDWADVETMRQNIPNNGRRYVTHKLTNVRHGTHLFTCNITWGNDTVREKTLTRIVQVNQSCGGQIILTPAGWCRDWLGMTSAIYSVAGCKPATCPDETYDVRLTVQPGDHTADRRARHNRPYLQVGIDAPIPRHLPHSLTMEIWWPSNGFSGAPTETHEITHTFPAPYGWCHCYLTQPSADPTHLQIWASCLAGTNRPAGNDATLVFTPEHGTIYELENPIPSAEDYRHVANWLNVPAGSPEITVDALFNDGYTTQWQGRAYRPVWSG